MSEIGTEMQFEELDVVRAPMDMADVGVIVGCILWCAMGDC